MKRSLPFVFAALLAFSIAAFGAEGLVAIKSPYAAKETMDRFEQNAKQRGLNVFARVDHAAGAAKIGKMLRPTEVLIFGNPQGGTPLMECAQSVGIDLPLKALVCEDAEGQVWLGYNDLPFLAQPPERSLKIQLLFTKHHDDVRLLTQTTQIAFFGPA